MLPRPAVRGTKSSLGNSEGPETYEDGGNQEPRGHFINRAKGQLDRPSSSLPDPLLYSGAVDKGSQGPSPGHWESKLGKGKAKGGAGVAESTNLPPPGGWGVGRN